MASKTKTRSSKKITITRRKSDKKSSKGTKKSSNGKKDSETVQQVSLARDIAMSTLLLSAIMLIKYKINKSTQDDIDDYINKNKM